MAVTGGFDSRFETLVKQMLLTSNNTVYNRNDRIFTHSSNINALPNTPLSKQQGIHLCHPSIRPNNMCSRPHQSLLYSITSVSDRGDIAVNFWLDFACCWASNVESSGSVKIKMLWIAETNYDNILQTSQRPKLGAAEWPNRDMTIISSIHRGRVMPNIIRFELLQHTLIDANIGEYVIW